MKVSMRFVAIERLRRPAIVTGKPPDEDGLLASIEEVEAAVNAQIAGLSTEEIIRDGWLHPDGNFFVDGWSGVVGLLVAEPGGPADEEMEG